MSAARSRLRQLVGGSLGDRGAAAVEFALILPILLLLVFGIIDFSRAYNARITLSQAAAEGARALAISSATSSTNDPTAQRAARTAVAAAVDGGLLTSGEIVYVTLQTCTSPTVTRPTPEARVQIRVPFRYATPLPGLARLAPFSVTATGVRQCSA